MLTHEQRYFLRLWLYSSPIIRVPLSVFRSGLRQKADVTGYRLRVTAYR